MSEFVSAQMGLHFPQERWRDLERGMRAAAKESGEDADAFAESLLSGPVEKARMEVLASQLTVGETYFFRENRSFEVLGERILPALIRSRQGGEQRLRVWSAGCCTGEEAYSIAIFLDRLLPFPSQWHVTILATDINRRFLQKAADGVYGEWSFRHPPAWLKGNYFTPVASHRYEILPRIRKMVTFAYLNLAEDTYPLLHNNTNAMDLIFCRNVLMYFEPDRARKVIGNFHHSLLDGGKLIVSQTEISSQLFPQFEPMHFEGAILYGKNNGRPSTPAFQFPRETIVPAPHATPVYFPVPEPAPPVLDQTSIEEPGIDTAPASPGIYHEALELFGQGKYLEAEQKLRADSGSETDAGAAALMARICANLGQLAEAQMWAEKAIAADKIDAALHYLRAIILQERGALGESAASLKRALYLDPVFVIAHHALGNLASRQQRFEEAARHFANALALLKRFEPDEILPHSDGLVAGRLREMIESSMSMEVSV